MLSLSRSLSWVTGLPCTSRVVRLMPPRRLLGWLVLGTWLLVVTLRIPCRLRVWSLLRLIHSMGWMLL